MYRYSIFNIDFPDDDMVVVANIKTAALLRFKKEKFYLLKKGDLKDAFSEEEISVLLKHNIVTDCDDEFSVIKEERIKAFNDDKVINDFTVTILTTTDCNARCYYCYESGITKHNMTLKTADEICNYIKKNHAKNKVRLNWFGGEPLYNSDVIDYICNYLKDCGIDYSSAMVTNGYLIDKYLDNFIGLWKVEKIQLTIDGIEDKYNRVKNYIYKEDVNPFERVMSNLKSLLDNNIRVNLRINFHPDLLENAAETIKYLHKKIGNPKGLMVYCAWLGGENIPGMNKYDSNNNPIIYLYNIMIDCGYIKTLNDIGIYPKTLTCSIHWKNLVVIDPNGNLYKCQHSVVEGTHASFGKISSDIINEKNYNLWYNLNYPYKKCETCICLPICQGGCRYQYLYNHKESACLPYKSCLKELIQIYYEKIYKTK